MVDGANLGDEPADRRAGHGHLAESIPADATPPYTDARVLTHIDVDSYAATIYRANLGLNLPSAQIEYDSTPELRELLAQASAASTVERRPTHRM